MDNLWIIPALPALLACPFGPWWRCPILSNCCDNLSNISSSKAAWVRAIEEEFGYKYTPYMPSYIFKDDGGGSDGGSDGGGNNGSSGSNGGGDNSGDAGGNDGSGDGGNGGDGSHYNPDEPRVPAGQPGGSQWTSGGSGQVMDDAGNLYPLDDSLSKPDGIPDNWMTRPANNGKGIKYTDPIASNEKFDTLSCARSALPSPASGRGVGRGRFAPNILSNFSLSAVTILVMKSGLPNAALAPVRPQSTELVPVHQDYIGGKFYFEDSQLAETLQSLCSSQSPRVNWTFFTPKIAVSSRLKKAIQLAGLELRAPGAARRVHIHEALFENLLNVWTHYGRQPVNANFHAVGNFAFGRLPRLDGRHCFASFGDRLQKQAAIGNVLNCSNTDEVG